MFSLVVLLLTCLHAGEFELWCGSLGEVYCDSDFQCLWSDGVCEEDNFAKIGNGASCGGYADCASVTYKGYSVTFSSIKGQPDYCSLDYYIAEENKATFTCDPNNCVEVEILELDGTSKVLCVDYCVAHPDDLDCYCLANPAAAACQCGGDITCECTANPSGEGCFCVLHPEDLSCQTCTSSGSNCCIVLNSLACTSFCQTTDTSLAYYCCGRPANYTSLTSQACNYYFAQGSHQSSSDYKSRLYCMNDPTNLTACALCDSYYECCSQFKKELPTVAADICDHFCSLPKYKDDEDCVARQQCIANGGSRETCAASQVRLSSFCVAFLLLIIGLFLL